MKCLRTPDAVKGKLLSLDCLAKMERLIGNLFLPDSNSAENHKLILTASHALLQAKSPFFQALSRTVMVSGTDHFLLPAPDRTLTKAGMVDPTSILFFSESWMTDLEMWGSGQTRPFRWIHSGRAEISGTKVSPDRHPLSWASLWSYLRGSKTLSEQLICCCFSSYIPRNNCSEEELGLGQEESTSSLQPSSSPWGLRLESKKRSLGVYVFSFFKEFDKCWDNCQGLGHWVYSQSCVRIRHFCQTQLRTSVPNPGSGLPSQKVYELGDFWKYSSYRILLPLCKRNSLFFFFWVVFYVYGYAFL